MNSLLIDIFGATIVGLKDDVGTGFFQGFLERGVLLAPEILGDEFGGGDNAGEAEATLWIGGDVVGEVFGVFCAADNDGTEGGTGIFEGEAANGADGATEEAEEEKTREDLVESEDTDWKEVEIEEKITGDDRHHADEGGEKEAADLAPTTIMEKDGFAIETEGGQDEEIDWDHNDHGEHELARISLEVKGALIEMGTHEVADEK